MGFWLGPKYAFASYIFLTNWSSSFYTSIYFYNMLFSRFPQQCYCSFVLLIKIENYLFLLQNSPRYYCNSIIKQTLFFQCATHTHTSSLFISIYLSIYIYLSISIYLSIYLSIMVFTTEGVFEVAIILLIFYLRGKVYKI